MTLTGVVQSIFGGLGTGSVYSLLGLSFALIFGRLFICSMIHGDLAILAAYFIYWLFTLWGVNPLISLIIFIPVFYFAGFGIQSLFLKPFMKLDVWKGRYQGQVMVTQGMGMVIMALGFIFWKGTYRTLATSYRNTALDAGAIKFSVVQIMSLVSLAILVILLNILLKKTKLGISLRACSDDRTTAMLTGIDYDRVCNMAFGISSAIAVVAGLFYSLMFPITPSLGMELSLKGWVAVIIGGMGSISGIVIAGLLVGLVESLTSYFWIPAYKEAVLFLGLLVFLVLKPHGLIKSK